MNALHTINIILVVIAVVLTTREYINEQTIKQSIKASK
jgi:hypothetical protein